MRDGVHFDFCKTNGKPYLRENKVTGSLAGCKDNDPTNHRLSGEIVTGTPPIIALRHDGAKAQPAASR
jgi:hypothetical protein